ncbi:MAG: histidinol dehydrogenase [Vulcanimicrobiota bacterium]
MMPLLRGAQARAWVASVAAAAQDPVIALRVSEILGQVRQQGDAALAELAERFGDPAPRLLSSTERQSGASSLGQSERQVLQQAAANIQRFHQAVASSLAPVRLEQPEYSCGMRLQPVARVACYAPGGRHPLPSTALMTGLAARAAGVPEIVLVCPNPHPAVLYAAELIGADSFYQMGGAQAVAALAYGTDTIPRVDMLVGPGNAYVAEAKRQLQGVIGIDMLAGPSEVAILADSGADPLWLALDLLAQAEHDPDARCCLLSWDEGLLDAVSQQIQQQLARGPYPDFLRQSLDCSALLLLKDLDECLAALDQLAPEHLHLAVAEPLPLQERLQHYGGLFLGYHSTVPYGDYMAGPNHTLPTGTSARFSGGLSPLTFLRPQCWLHVPGPSPGLSRDTVTFAELEGLHGHAAAARARL